MKLKNKIGFTAYKVSQNLDSEELSMCYLTINGKQNKNYVLIYNKLDMDRGFKLHSVHNCFFYPIPAKNWREAKKYVRNNIKTEFIR